MRINITKGKVQYFKRKLGGRIVYHNFRRSLTPEYDYVIYIVCNHYRAKGKTMWDCAILAQEELWRHKIYGSKWCVIYYNHIISRFYIIRQAINATKTNYGLTNEGSRLK